MSALDQVLDLAATAAASVRRFNPGQARDPHTGEWTDTSVGAAASAATSYTWERIQEIYGNEYDDQSAGDFTVATFTNGDFLLAFRHPDRDDAYSPVWDGPESSDDVRDLAEAVRWAASEDIPDDAVNGELGLVDWRYATEGDVLVGYDARGDVSLMFPTVEDADEDKADDWDRYDVGVDDGAALADALNAMADRMDELEPLADGPVMDVTSRKEERRLLQSWFDTTQFDATSPGIPPMAPEDDDEPEGSSDTTRHLPGLHDQKSHGRRKTRTIRKKIGGIFADVASKQDALDAVPAKLKRAPNGHHGHYEGEELTGPPGMGSVRALSEYEGIEYQGVNIYLRRGPREVGVKDPSNPHDPAVLNEEWNDKNAARIVEIDKTMAVSRTTSDVRVDRAIKSGATVWGDDVWYGDVVDFNEPDLDKVDQQMEIWESGVRPNLTGLRWREGGYSSTTADPAVAQDFGKRWPDALYPSEGEPVIMTILVPKGTGAVQLSEMGHAAEVLLERGLTFEVVADNGVVDRFRRLDVRVVPDGE